MNLYLKILSLIKPYWKHVILVIILSVFYVFFNNLSLWITVDFVQELFTPSETTQIVNTTANDTNMDKIKDLIVGNSEDSFYIRTKTYIKSLLIQEDKYDTLLMVCFFVFFTFLMKNLVRLLNRLLLEIIALNIVTTIRTNLHRVMLKLPLSFYHKRHSGDLTSIAFNDVYSLNTVLNASFGKMIVSPIQILGNILILFSISVKLSLITLILIPLTAFVMVKIGKSIRRKSRRVFKEISNVLTSFQESISAVRIVKAFTNEERETEKFEKANQAWFKKTFRKSRLDYLTSPLNETMYISLVVVLLWYGANMVYSNTALSAEDFLRFLLFLFTMIQPIKDLSGVNNIIQTGMAAAERVFGIIEAKTEQYESPNNIIITDFEDKIEYENISLQYDSGNTEVLTDISFTVKKGEVIAFVGYSGSGKTSLVNLLPRFYIPTNGKILIDGLDINDVQLHSLRQQMSIVTQDTILFNDTLRMNIGYGIENISEEEIVKAAKIANAWEFIEKSELGLDTQIGEKGVMLSGGQKQRISIARAILKNPPILILDEATSALDTESEKLVQEAIYKLLESRTVLVIAHRLSTIQNATKIVVLDDGKIESIGVHNDLLENSKVYKKLYTNQKLKESSN